MAWYLYGAVVAAGFSAGFVNTLAGSGSLITLPLLIFLGLPATIANGTNRVAILLQNVVAVKSFHNRGLLDTRSALLLAVPVAAGAVVGAAVAVDLDEAMMRRAIGVMMLAMLALLIARPSRWIEGRPESARLPLVGRWAILFAIGLYGGFVQAGVGILLLTALAWITGKDVVRANALKLLVILCLTAIALSVFVVNGQVWWGIGLVLAAGNMAGAWFAARVSVRRGAAFVRLVLVAVVAISAAVFLGLPGAAAALLRSLGP